MSLAVPGLHSAGECALVERPDGAGAVCVQTSNRLNQVPFLKVLHLAWAARQKERVGPSGDREESRRGGSTKPKGHFPQLVFVETY